MDSPSLDSDQHKCNGDSGEAAGRPDGEAVKYRPPCGRRSISRVVVVDGREVREYRRIPCKKWSCPACGPKKVNMFGWAAGEAASRYELRRLMTLTLDPLQVPEGVKPIKHLKHVWRKFRVPMTRKFGRSVRFLWVLELHKSGMPHLHVLIDEFVPQRWLSATWSRYGGGRVVDIRDAGGDMKKIGWYLAKYLSKGLMNRLPWRERRYGTSKSVKLREDAECGEKWELVPVGLDTIRADRNEVVLESGFDDFGNLIRFLAERDLNPGGNEDYPDVPFTLEYSPEVFGGKKTIRGL